MHVKIFLLIFQFMYCNQHYFSNAEPIVGRSVQNARENEFPFIVSIGGNFDQDAELNHFCTGSLISRRHVLTAAHCFEKEVLTKIRVYIGSVDLRAAEKFAVSWWLKFDDWLVFQNIAHFRDNDIAVAKLARSVNDQRIVPATLSPLNSFTVAGLSLNIAGWGDIEGGVIPRYLRTVRVNAINLFQCCQMVSGGAGNPFMTIPLTHICTRSNPSALITCGDSGGPLFTDNHEIIGIHFAICPEDYDNYENNVNLHLCIDIYRDFINDMLRR